MNTFTDFPFGHWAAYALLNVLGGAALTGSVVDGAIYGLAATLGLWLVLTLAIRMFLHMQYQVPARSVGIAAVDRARARGEPIFKDRPHDDRPRPGDPAW